MTIYKVTNKVNGKIYVGKDSTDNPNYMGSGKIIRRAIKKYGLENFVKEILETCNDLSEMNDREIFWIQKLNCIQPNGYNICKGGNGGDIFTNNPDAQLIKDKLRQSRIKIRNLLSIKSKNNAKINPNYGMRGKRHSSKSIEKMKESRKFVIYTKEWKDNLSKARKGKNHWHYGKSWSDEVKEKIRKTNSQKVTCPYCGKVGGIRAMNRYHMNNCKYKV